jgi:CheY-like chemotaxis protein
MTVLIVDDQADFRGFARRVLEADGYRIRLRGARKGVSQCARSGVPASPS